MRVVHAAIFVSTLSVVDEVTCGYSCPDIGIHICAFASIEPLGGIDKAIKMSNNDAKPKSVIDNTWTGLVTTTEAQTPQEFIHQLAMETKRRPDVLSRERDRSSKQAPKEEKNPKYTVYVRLPFKRGDFVDPPPVIATTVYTSHCAEHP